MKAWRWCGLAFGVAGSAGAACALSDGPAAAVVAGLGMGGLAALVAAGLAVSWRMSGSRLPGRSGWAAEGGSGWGQVSAWPPVRPGDFVDSSPMLRFPGDCLDLARAAVEECHRPAMHDWREP